jgi:plastocyanin
LSQRRLGGVAALPESCFTLVRIQGNGYVTFASLQPATNLLHFHRRWFADFIERGAAMRIFSWRFTLVITAAASLIFHLKAANAATFDVTVGPNGNLVFSPSSVTIHPGDQVRWTFGSSGHITTSGSPGMPNGIWDSGIRNQGAVFTHTFSSAGTFPFYCTPHGGCCGMVGTVTVVNASPTPTSTPRPTATPTPASTATPKPVVTTNPATQVAAFSATLNGSVNPRGTTTMVSFQYGLTTSYGSTTPMQTQNGNTVRPVSANIAGLLANRIYHFRIVAHNNGGTSFGVDRTFTTLTATGPPVVATNPATLLASFSATLNGSLNPHGLNTTVSFQYGPTTAYGSTTPMQTKTGNTYLGIVANISGLSPNTLYHFRIVATNSAGTRFGGDRTFRTLSVTGPPVATTNPATFIASFSARLNALINPHGLPTSVHFQYGITPSYGLTTAPQNRTGNTFQAVAANVAGLTANTLYHFRVVASNNAGTIMGSDRTFTTLTPTGPPVVITNGPTNVAASSATLNGSLNPHGLATNVFFQYGTTTSYGSATPMQSQNGNTYRNITANINGLTPHSTYHFRMIATNAGGTRMGSDRTFTTH